MSTRYSRLILLVALLLAWTARPSAAQFTSPPVHNPGNGHWYQAVRVAGAISWDDARAAAESLAHAGYRGHLLTSRHSGRGHEPATAARRADGPCRPGELDKRRAAPMAR